MRVLISSFVFAAVTSVTFYGCDSAKKSHSNTDIERETTQTLPETAVKSEEIAAHSVTEIPKGLPVPKVEPQTGTVKDIVDKKLEMILRQPVTFQNKFERDYTNHKIMCGVPIQPNGEPVDYSNTSYQKIIDQGYFENSFCALLKRKDINQFELLEFDLGSTDLPIETWKKTYQVQ